MFKLKSLGLLVALMGIFALFAYTVSGWVGALLVLGVGFAINWFSMDRAAGLILRWHRARSLSPREAPQLHYIADELASRADIPVPHLLVYPGEMPNAFALSTRAERGAVAVSSALLRLLDRREIAGVLAHEFAHLKNRDSVLSLSAGIFVQAITWLSHGFGLFLLLYFLAGTGPLITPALWPVLVLVGLAPTGAVLLQAALMRTRERLADRDGALLSGDPQGLASALYKLQQYSRYLARWYRRFRFIYTSSEDGGTEWLRTHPSTEERVRALLEMEEKMRRHPLVDKGALYRPFYGGMAV